MDRNNELTIYYDAKQWHHKNIKGIRLVKNCIIKEWDYKSNDGLILIPNLQYKPEYEEFNILYGPHEYVTTLIDFGKIFKGNKLYFNTLSEWVKLCFEKYVNKSIKMMTLPFPVDVNKFKPEDIKHNKCFVYLKFHWNQPAGRLDRILNIIKKHNYDFKIFSYGNYNEEEYYDYIKNCKFGIWSGCSESQGFALEEALSCDCPVYVIDKNFEEDEIADNIMKMYGEKIPCTSAPYFDNRCGMKQIDITEETFNEFINLLETYKPREYVMENLTEKQFVERAKNIYDIMTRRTTKNITLITSIIKTPNTPFSYISTRSVYTVEERFEQTKKTIESVKKHIPNTIIMMVECSDLDETMEIYLRNNVDIFINLINDKEAVKNIYSKSKAAGEGTMTIHALKYIEDNKIKFNNFYKISGRYHINNTFSFDNFDNDYVVVKKINNEKDNVNCSFYKLNPNSMYNWLKYLENSKKEFTECVGYEKILASFINKLDPVLVRYLNTIGIEGCVSVDGSVFNL